MRLTDTSAYNEWETSIENIERWMKISNDQIEEFPVLGRLQMLTVIKNEMNLGTESSGDRRMLNNANETKAFSAVSVPLWTMT